MAADGITKRRRSDVCLAILSFMLASVNALTFPVLAFAWLFAWSMNDPLGSQSPPDALPTLACLGGMVLLGGSLCFGFVAGISLLRGQPWGRRLSAVLAALAACHIALATLVVVILCKWDLSKVADGLIRSWLWALIHFDPSLIYGIVAPVLLITDKQPRPVDRCKAAKVARLPREHSNSSLGTLPENRVCGMTPNKPARKHELPPDRTCEAPPDR